MNTKDFYRLELKFGIDRFFYVGSGIRLEKKFIDIDYHY